MYQETVWSETVSHIDNRDNQSCYWVVEQTIFDTDTAHTLIGLLGAKRTFEVVQWLSLRVNTYFHSGSWQLRNFFIINDLDNNNFILDYSLTVLLDEIRLDWIGWYGGWIAF